MAAATAIATAAAGAIVGIVNLFTDGKGEQIKQLKEDITKQEKAHSAKVAELEKDKTKLKEDNRNKAAAMQNMENDHNARIEAERKERNTLNEQLDRARGASESVRNELRGKIEEIERNIESLRQKKEKELAELRKKHEDEQKESNSKLLEMTEKRVREEKQHGEKMNALHGEIQRVYNAGYQMVLALEKNAHEKEKRMLNYISTSHAGFSNAMNSIKDQNQVEKDWDYLKSKLKEISQVIDVMAECRKTIMMKLLHADRSSTQNVEISQVADKMISIDFTKLRELVKCFSQHIYSQNLSEEAKSAVASINLIIEDLFEEMMTFGRGLKRDMDSVDLSGIKNCLDNLRTAVIGFPPMPTQNVNDFITNHLEQMTQEYNRFTSSNLESNHSIDYSIITNPSISDRETH